MKHRRGISTTYSAILGLLFSVSQILRINSFPSTVSPIIILAPSLAQYQRCFRLASSTEHCDESSNTKLGDKSRKTGVPTARYLAVVALASRPRGSNEVDSTAFASRRLDMDARYKLLDSKDRSFSKLLVVSWEFISLQIGNVLYH